MHDYFVKNTFGLLNGGFFNNLYKRNYSYLKKGNAVEENEEIEEQVENEEEEEEKEGRGKKKEKGEDKMFQIKGRQTQKNGNRILFDKDLNKKNNNAINSNNMNRNRNTSNNAEDLKYVQQLKKEFDKQLIYSYYNNITNKNSTGQDKGLNDRAYVYTENAKNNNEMNTNIMKKHMTTNNKFTNNNGINRKSHNSNNTISDYEPIKSMNSELLFLKNNMDEPITKENKLYAEFNKIKNDLLALQLMNINLQKQMLANNIMNAPNMMPQHIIINNKTEVASNAISEVNNEKKKNKGTLYYIFKKIFKSRLNQMIIVSSVFISIYLINKQWQRALKVSQLEKKINSNILLRSVKFFEQSLGIRKFG